MKRRNSIFYLIILPVLFMTIGYSSFNNNLYIDNMGMVVRAVKDIRITNISIHDSNNATSSYEEYDVNSIVMGVNLNSADSSITYVVDVTNFGNAEMGIFEISGIDESSNITYEISNYTIKDKICNEENVCSNGITKSFYITIKHKENVTTTSNYDIRLTFDFRMLHSVSYEEIELSSEFPLPHEVLNGDDLVVNFVPYTVADVEIYLGSLLFNDYTYVDGILTIKNIEQDVKIVAITYEKEALESTQASRNLQDSISLIQTAEGALSEVQDILHRIFQLTVQIINSDYNTETDIEAGNNEIAQLIPEINYISQETWFDVYDILNADRVYEIVLPRENINLNLYKINSSILNIDKFDYISKENVEEYLNIIQTALDNVSLYRAYLGSRQNEFEPLVDYFDSTAEVLNAADRLEVTHNNLALVGLSKIRDYLDSVIYLETTLEYGYYEEIEKKNAKQQIDYNFEGINYIVNDCQLKGVYFLKGDYSFIPNVSTDYLGEGNTPIFVDFSTPENITKSRNDAQQALDKINNLINQISNGL